MPKSRMTLKVRLPEYKTPRTAWRKAIHKAIMKKLNTEEVSYDKKAKFEILLRLYLKGRAAEIHDVDNRLKDILDALQGHVGGRKKRSAPSPPSLRMTATSGVS